MLFKDRLEVWNPGNLPHGMTIEKLHGVHSSRPVNPVLANPVYLTGYIEQMGTGTTDIIKRCLSAGLHAPDFIQDEDFRTILWRPAGQETGHETGNEREQEREHEREHEKEHETEQVTKQVKKIILTIKGDTKSREEIMELLLLNGRRNFIENYLTPAIEAGLVTMLYPDMPKRKGQAYYLTAKGLELLRKLKKK